VFLSGLAITAALAASLTGAPAQTNNQPKKTTAAPAPAPPPKPAPPAQQQQRNQVRGPAPTGASPNANRAPGSTGTAGNVNRSPGSTGATGGFNRTPGSMGTAGNAGRGPGSTAVSGAGERERASVNTRNTGSGADRRTSITHVRQPGEEARALPGGHTAFRSAAGHTVIANERGQVRRIEGPAGLAGNRMVIDRVPGRGRIVENGRLGNRAVSYGPRHGFVEREYPGRRGYISRTYFVGGRSYAHVYREYSYHGVRYYHYVPAYYYGPRFYVWAVTPWAPAPYYWGNGLTAPWVGFYGGYFAPAPVYASPDMWLTDYLLTENLRLAYESEQAANGGQAPPPQAQTNEQGQMMNDPAQMAAMKALIADEVRQQLEAEKAAAVQPTSSNPGQAAPATEQLPPALNQKFFVTSSNLDLTVAGKVCSLTPGDVIQRTGKVVQPDGTIAVQVVTSKPGDCARESDAAVQLADLQEMHNQFREQLDNGLKVLADNQAKAQGVQAGARRVDEGTAEPLADAGQQLLAQEQAAGTLEDQVRQ
jgi:hypothetical protein